MCCGNGVGHEKKILGGVSIHFVALRGPWPGGLRRTPPLPLRTLIISTLTISTLTVLALTISTLTASGAQLPAPA
jgi:hypothetical protein